MSDTYREQPIEAHKEETRRALVLLGRVLGGAVLIYLLVAGIVTMDPVLHRYGQPGVSSEGVPSPERQMEWATSRAWSVDRSDDASRVFLLGDSTVDAAFDTEVIQRDFEVRGLPWRVETLAFPLGAPVFAWAMTEQVDLRAGDRVVLGIHYHHFRQDWLAEHEGAPSHMRHILRPKQLADIPSLRWDERLHYAQMLVQPAGLYRKRKRFREGLQRWLLWLFAGAPAESRPRVTASSTIDERRVVPNFRQRTEGPAFTLDAQNVVVEEGQINLDAMVALDRLCKEKGAELWVVFMTPAPEYYERFERGRFSEAFHRALGGRWERYMRLTPMAQRFYRDYEHVNARGRSIVSRQLVQWMTGPRAVTPTRREGEE